MTTESEVRSRWILTAFAFVTALVVVVLETASVAQGPERGTLNLPRSLRRHERATARAAAMGERARSNATASSSTRGVADGYHLTLLDNSISPCFCVGGMHMHVCYARAYAGCTPRGRAYGQLKTTFMCRVRVCVVYVSCMCRVRALPSYLKTTNAM